MGDKHICTQRTGANSVSLLPKIHVRNNLLKDRYLVIDLVPNTGTSQLTIEFQNSFVALFVLFYSFFSPLYLLTKNI